MTASATETRSTFCRICEASCGLEVEVAREQIVKIRPDAKHVGTSGFGCIKGLHQHELYSSPDRLLRPQRRKADGSHESVSWEQALGGIGSKLAELRKVHGPDSIAMYVGTAAGFSLLHPIFAQGFMTGIGSKQMYSSATQDCANKFAVSRLMYGFPFTLPFPDLDRTRCLIVVGANPVVSKWSFLQVSNPTKRLRDIEARGGKIIVIDPRRTETAKAAGRHLFIRPDTDAFFYLAFLHELLARGAYDRSRLDAHFSGFDAIETLVRDWSPERCAEVTRISAADLRSVVDDYLEATEAGGAALYCSTGVNMGRHGSLGYWLQEVINAISGNLDRPGGTLVGQGVVDFPAFGAKRGILMRKDRSRVGNYGSVNDAFPGGVLADEILTPGRGQIKALIVTGGNPLLTMANSGRLREALTKLDLLVTLDIFPSETGTLAHYQLPCTSPLERADLPFIFPFMLGLQSRPYLQATRPVVPPPGECRDEATIYLDLCRAAGVGLFGSRIAQRGLELARNRHTKRNRLAQPRIPQEALLSLLLRISGQGSFEALSKETHGRPRPVGDGRDFLGRRVHTEDGRVHLAPAPLLEATRELEAHFARERDGAEALKLITKREVRTHNSWTHNAERFAGAGQDTNYLFMHPDDAATRGLEAGEFVDVRSATGRVRIGLRLLDELMPGTVALPHGWGHQHAKGLSVASKTKGVNVNVLAADGPGQLERVSGMAHLTGIPVEVTRADGEFDPESWTGTPEGRFDTRALTT